MRFDLTTLRLFVAVIEHGSIAKAAELEHIVPSAVSKRLSDLEFQLGISLLTRQHAGVIATPAGEALARHARDVIRTLDRIPRELNAISSEDRITLRVWANQTATVGYVLDDIHGFQSRHPQINIRFEERPSLPTIDAVANGAQILAWSDTSSRRTGCRCARTGECRSCWSCLPRTRLPDATIFVLRKSSNSISSR